MKADDRGRAEPPAAKAAYISEPSRSDWVDTVKGVAILLVTLLHTTNAAIEAGIDVGVVGTTNDALGVVRMPVFFLVSGLFAARSLSSPWRTFAQRKVGKFAWLYLLWSTVLILMAALAGHLRATEGLHEARREALRALTVSESLWYLLALPLFFLATRLLRGVPNLLVLTAATALSSLSTLHLLDIGSWGINHMLQYWIWFLAGTFYGPKIIEWVESCSIYRTLLVVLGALVAAGTARFMLPEHSGFGSLLVPIAAVPACLTLVKNFSSLRYGPQPVRAIGQRTLPVYVLHPPLLILAGALVTFETRLSPLLLIPAAASVALAAVLIGRILEPARWLWDTPFKPSS